MVDAGACRAKAALRARFRALRRGLDAATRAAETAAACARAAALLRRRASPPLAAYAALADELDLAGLLGAEWSARRRVWLPRVQGQALTWHAVSGPDDLSPGAYGIREPDPARVPAASLPVDCLVLVPGVAFAADGRRLGQGGGFYDRLLAASPRLSVGIGFACQRCDALPVEVHDARLDGVILGGEMLRDPG